MPLEERSTRLTLKNSSFWRQIDSAESYSFQISRKKRFPVIHGELADSLIRLALECQHIPDGVRAPLYREIFVLESVLQSEDLHKTIYLRQRSVETRHAKREAEDEVVPPPAVKQAPASNPILPVLRPVTQCTSWSLKLTWLDAESAPYALVADPEVCVGNWKKTWEPRVEVDFWMLDNAQRLLILYHLQVMLFTFSTFFSRQPLRSFLTEDGMDLLIGVALNVSKDSALQDNLSRTLTCLSLTKSAAVIRRLLRRFMAHPFVRITVPAQFINSRTCLIPEYYYHWCGGVWLGPMRNGQPFGRGLWTHGGDTGVFLHHDGEWEHGMPNGDGVVKYHFKTKLLLTFEGSFRDGSWLLGRILWPDGSWYHGPAGQCSVYAASRRTGQQYRISVIPFMELSWEKIGPEQPLGRFWLPPAPPRPPPRWEDMQQMIDVPGFSTILDFVENSETDPPAPVQHSTPTEDLPLEGLPWEADK